MPHSSNVLPLVFSACLGGLVACAGAVQGRSAPSELVEVDVARLKTSMDTRQVALIDVRTPTEFAEGHAPGAINIPLDELGKRMSELEPHKNDEIYLICRSGGRSARAQSQLSAAGFAHPINVSGGTLAWRAAGHPVE